jgi:lipopolysaccharide export system permease protein
VKTLNRYLLRQILASLLLTLGVFTFVLLLANVLKEVLPLLVNRQASLGTLTEFVGLLIPYVWLYALPMSVLTAILLSFGRFSADHELTAARASGISLLSLALPVLGLSLALCGLCAWINLDLGPSCRKAYRELRFKFLAELSSALLPERQFVRDFPGYIFFVGENNNGQLADILIVVNHPDGAVTKVRAETGRLEVDANPTNRIFRLQLAGVRGTTLSPQHELVHEKGDRTLEVPLSRTQKGPRRVAIGDLTFAELRREYREVEARLAAPPAEGPNAISNSDWQRELAKQRREVLSPLRVELHRKLALSFSCFGFALVGIPLGIRVQRRESNIGFAVALVLVVVYYAFILLGSALETKPQFLPQLWVWAPNFLFQIVGATLLWRANRGG